MNYADGAGSLVRRLEAVGLQQLAQHPDLGERGTELMRYTGDEILAKPSEALLSPEHECGGAPHGQRQHEQSEDRGQTRRWKSSRYERLGRRGVEARRGDEAP